MLLSNLLIISIFLLHSNPVQSQDTYDGHYDLRARDAAYLCVLMEEYVKTGKQPSLTKYGTPDKLDKQFFTKGKPCYRFGWKACDAATYSHTNQRPCGWYQMESAPDSEC